MRSSFPLHDLRRDPRRERCKGDAVWPEGEWLRGERLKVPPPLEYQAFTGTMLHETADPEFIVVEYDIQGVTTSSRTPFRLGVIRTLRVHDGHIVLLLEYMNPLALTEALNR